MSRRTLLWAVGILVTFLALYPTGWLVYGSFRTAPPLEPGSLSLVNYARALADPLLLRTLSNTLTFSIGQMAVAVGLGTLFGWIVMRTDTPGRRMFETILMALFLVPTLLAVVAWTMLLSPGKGIINRLLVETLGLDAAPFDIYSMPGMIFVQGLYLTPLAYLTIAPTFSAIDSSMEESARMSGSGHLQTLRRIILPLARPAVFSAALVLLVVGLESFDIPQLLGGPKRVFTITSLIYSSIEVFYPPDYGRATALAVMLLLASLACVEIYRRTTAQAQRFETVKGKSYRAQPLELGAWRWVAAAVLWLFIVVTVALPFAILVLGSFLEFFGRFDATIFSRMTWTNYTRIFRHPQLIDGFRNSLFLAVAGGAACVLLSAVVAYITVKGQARSRMALDFIAMLPIAFPSTVLALALLWAWITIPLPVYGTLVILAIAYVTRYLPIGLRSVAGGMVQIGGELEEASTTAGAGWITTFRRIILPLLWPTLMATWIMMFMIFLRELSMSILLAGPGNPVVSVVLFDYYSSGELGPLSAAAVMMILVVLLVVGAARRMLNSPTTPAR